MSAWVVVEVLAKIIKNVVLWLKPLFSCLGKFYTDDFFHALDAVKRVLRSTRRDHSVVYQSPIGHSSAGTLTSSSANGESPNASGQSLRVFNLDPDSQERPPWPEVERFQLIQISNGNEFLGDRLIINAWSRTERQRGVISEVYSGILKLPIAKDSERSNPERSNTAVQIKYMKLSHRENCECRNIDKRLKEEAVKWLKVDSPRVLPFYGLYQDTHRQNRVVTVSQLFYGVYYRLHGNGILPKSRRLEIVKQVADGISYLHSLEIVHGDLRAQNIVVNSNNSVKIVDFGYLCTIPRNSAAYIENHLESVKWCAPELLLVSETSVQKSCQCPSPPLTKASDVWALGITVLEIMDGHNVLWGASITGVYLEPSALLIAIDIRNGVKPNYEHYPYTQSFDGLWDALLRCWSTMEGERCGAKEFYECITPICGP